MMYDLRNMWHLVNHFFFNSKSWRKYEDVLKMKPCTSRNGFNIILCARSRCTGNDCVIVLTWSRYQLGITSRENQYQTSQYPEKSLHGGIAFNNLITLEVSKNIGLSNWPTHNASTIHITSVYPKDEASSYLILIQK